MCDHRVVPKRGVVPDRCNPSGAAEDACGDALAGARRAEREADGGVLYVPQALSVSPSASRINAQRIARCDPYCTRNCLPLKKLRREIQQVYTEGYSCQQYGFPQEQGKSMQSIW